MTIEHQKVEDLLGLVHKIIPDWDGFSHPKFVEEEVAYKQEAVRKAQQLLAREELDRLISQEQYEEIILRLEKIARSTNLLFQGIPSKGDLNILYQPALDKATFSRAVFDLLYGPGDAPQRLDRYVYYVVKNSLPNRWTFPTYLLFLCFPVTEMFIKPRTMKWILEFVDQGILWDQSPGGKAYAGMRQAIYDLREAMQSFKPRDMIDLQGLTWLALRAASGKESSILSNEEENVPSEPLAPLAAPFSQMFSSRTEAEWAFDLLKKVSEKLGIHDSHPLATYTIRRRTGGYSLRLSFGSWLIVGFSGIHGRLNEIILALPDDYTDAAPDEKQSFAQSAGEQVISLYFFSATEIFPFQDHLQEALDRSLTYIAERFRNWQGSPHHHNSNLAVARAVFDTEQRDKLLGKGLDVPVKNPDPPVLEPNPKSPFSPESFLLLSGLRQNPTASFYLENKEHFKTHVEGPFQNLMQQAAARLPLEITQVMETEKNIFARILKNDFGLGGAWEFYWGAFYTRSGKRTEDAQLATGIHPDRFEIGFFVGSLGTAARARLARNCKNHYAALIGLLKHLDSDPELYMGPQLQQHSVIMAEWLADPLKYNCDVSLDIPRAELLLLSEEELLEKILRTFQKLFPLVLLASSDDPLPAIARYLGQEEEEQSVLQPELTLDRCAQITGFELDQLQQWVRAISRKGQAILYGPPGTGKTFVARTLAQHLVGGGDGFCELVQFHPAYAYEDFMAGIRPQPLPEGVLHYPVVKGRFMTFCEEAARRSGTCVLIIDEINRANLARVFGELMYLLEYRDEEIPLATGEMFCIPTNVHLIGTMNTADRSIALVDHALRRRFVFLELRPNYDALQRYHQNLPFDVRGLTSVLKKLNKRIDDANYEVGISYFLTPHLRENIRDIWEMEIIPYLREFFFDRPERAEEFCWSKVHEEIGA